ncbi:MAG: hypothetical protein R3E39_27585 [Anaerolineae bacterium]
MFRAVHIHQTAAVVYGLDHIKDVTLEQTQCIGNSNHHSGNRVVTRFRQRVQINITILIGEQFTAV